MVGDPFDRGLWPSSLLTRNPFKKLAPHLTIVLNEACGPAEPDLFRPRRSDRRAIVARLAAGDATVGELARPFDISGPAISRHLRVLEEARLIERRVEARWRVCSLRRDRLAEAERWINDARLFWERGFDRLEALLNAQDPSKPKG